MRSRKILASFALVSALSSCSPVILKRDTFIPIDSHNSDKLEIDSKLKLSAPTELFDGTVLFYETISGKAILTKPSGVANSSEQNSLYEYRDGGAISLNQSSAQFISAKLYEDVIYFTEKKTTVDKTVLARIKGGTTTYLHECSINDSIPFSVSEFGTVVFAVQENGKRKIYISANGEDKTEVASVSLSYDIKRLGISEKSGKIIFLASVTEAGKTSSSLIFGIPIKGGDLEPIDINVSDFVLLPSIGEMFYSKTSASGVDNIYQFNLMGTKSEHILNDTIEKFSVSPTGHYLAYLSRPNESKPIQTLYIVNIESKVKRSLINNASIASSIYWIKGEKGIIYTESPETTEKPKQGYITKQIVFSAMYP